jgi:predicted PurR-regulated permease PerM
MFTEDKMRLNDVSFSSLDSQYNSFWSNHDLQSAIVNLNSINNYVGGGVFDLYNANQLFTPEVLAPFYATQTNQDISTVAANVPYTTMLTWYSSYWQNQINTISDTSIQIQAMANMSSLNQILSVLGTSTQQIGQGVSNVVSGIGNFLSSPVIIIGLCVIGLYFITKD